MGRLSDIFKKKSKRDSIDLSIVGTDLHSHLIPGIDDGSKSIEESLALLKKFSELGYRKVITTPHVMSDFYKNNPEVILDGLEELRAAVIKEGIPIAVDAAAEYYLDHHLDELITKKELLTFGDNHVLFELSFIDEPPRLKETIFKLITEGYKPIMAHIERYLFYVNAWETIEDLKHRGCLLQLNINSLSGQYGPRVKKMAEAIIEKDLIDVIGSDCHHMGHLEIIENLRTNPHLHRIVKKETLLNRTL